MTPVAAQLASFAISARSDELPAGVREQGRLHFLDAIGCGLAAVGTGAARHATHVVDGQGGYEQSSLLGSPRQTAAAPAALANGARCHALDFDDTHEQGICHSSAVVAPAALAVAEASRRSGRELLDAFIVGSEVALRIGVGIADGLYARGFHPTSVCGVFGAAAAAARLRGHETETATNALGIAGSFASGLFEYLSDGSATKQLHAGWAAHAGVQAAELAAAGATGPATVIEGRFGLIASHTDQLVDVHEIAVDLGERWEVAELAIKPYPACHFAHASTWAAGELAARHPTPISEIAEVVVAVPTEGAQLVLDPIADKIAPRTPYEAKFSLPYMVADRLIHGDVDLHSFSAERIRDRQVLALAALVRGEVLERPPSRFAGSASIRTVTGQEFESLVEHAPGTPANPLSDARIASKFRANAELSLSSTSAAALAGLLERLDDQETVSSVGDLLRYASEGDSP